MCSHPSPKSKETFEGRWRDWRRGGAIKWMDLPLPICVLRVVYLSPGEVTLCDSSSGALKTSFARV